MATGAPQRPGSLSNDPGLRPFIIPETCVNLTGRQLGVGSYGSVEEVEIHGMICAGKKIHEALVQNDGSGTESVVRRKYVEECRLLAELRHPRIVKFLGLHFVRDSVLPVLLMEKLPTSLDDVLTKYDQGDPQNPKPVIPLDVKVPILCDVVMGLRYLHTRTPKAVLHRDLSAKNVLLDAHNKAKISGLGSSVLVSEQMHDRLTPVPGTMVYMPPESSGEPARYGRPLDIFSFGHLTLYTLIQLFPCDLLPAIYRDEEYQKSTGRRRWLARTEVQRRERYIKRLRQNLGVHHPLVQLVESCLEDEAEDRPSAEQVLQCLEELNVESHYQNATKLEIVCQLGAQKLENSAAVNAMRDDLDSKKRDIASRRESEQEEERATTAERELEGASKRVEEAERQAREAEQRATLADLRVTVVEQRATIAEQDIRRANERAEAAQQQTEHFRLEVQAAQQRVREAEQRVRETEERAVQREMEADQRTREAEQRMGETERRAREADALVHTEISGITRLLQRQVVTPPTDPPHWAVHRNEIRMTEEELGRGGWGVVKVARFRGLRVAAKCLYGEILNAHNRQLFTREMNMAARAHHPHLLQFIGATMEGEPVILTELMPTSLRAVLGRGALTRQQIVCIATQVAQALNYLHLMRPDPIIHRDVSSANVLLEPIGPNQWKAKVSDYGSVNFQRRVSTVGPGNPTYAAPESHIPRQQSPKMDIFSFGVLLLEMASGHLPAAEDHARLLQAVRWEALRQLIEACIRDDPDRRPSMENILGTLSRM